ncbi:MAG: hypothetical protein RLZZ34_1373, partial [Verrucomicrobiota bacterium]
DVKIHSVPTRPPAEPELREDLGLS